MLFKIVFHLLPFSHQTDADLILSLLTTVCLCMNML